MRGWGLPRSSGVGGSPKFATFHAIGGCAAARLSRRVHSVGPALRSWWEGPALFARAPGNGAAPSTSAEPPRSLDLAPSLPTDDDHVATVVAAATQAPPAVAPPVPVAEHEPESTSTDHCLSPLFVPRRYRRIVGTGRRRTYRPDAVSLAAAAPPSRAQSPRTRTYSPYVLEG